MQIKQKLQSIKGLNDLYTKWKWRERKVTFGSDHPDKTFFVIRRAYCKVGLFSYVMTNMGLVDHALKQGYIPVIDMQNGRNTYLEDAKVGQENAWEYYFEQPCGYSLGDIRNAQNVILSNGLITAKNNYPDFTVLEEQEAYAYWHTLFQKYFKVREELVREFRSIQKELFGESRVLGILARGTDYVSARPKGHPVQPDASQIIDKAKEVMRTYPCDRIYLATEDAEIHAKLKAAFGDLLVSQETERYTTAQGQNINDFRKEQDKALKGKEYLFSVMLLSCCDYLVAGNVGGTQGAVLMSPGYTYQYIFQLGRYS